MDKEQLEVAKLFQQETGCSDDCLKWATWTRVLDDDPVIVTTKRGFKKKVHLSRELKMSLKQLEPSDGLCFPVLGGKIPPYPRNYMYHQKFEPYKSQVAANRGRKQYEAYLEYQRSRRTKNRPKILGILKKEH